MGIVIHHSFGSSRSTTETSAMPAIAAAVDTSCFNIPQLLWGYDEARAHDDFAFMRRERLIVESVCGRVEAMRVCVFTKPRPSDNVLACIERERSALRGIPMETLCRRLMLNDPARWTVRRCYFGALVTEFVARVHQAEIWSKNR